MAKQNKIQKTKNEIYRNFCDSFQALQISAQAYDDGKKGATMLLAASIYIFVHDKGKRTQSLLSLVGRKNILFINTARPLNPKNLLTEMPFVMMRLATDGTSDYVPRLDELPNDNPEPEQRFNKWWNAPVLRDNQRRELTRKNMIFQVRHGEGGGHVDGKISEILADMSRKNSMGWSFIFDGKQHMAEFGPLYASVRQIAFEVEQTLKQNCADILNT